MKENKYWEIKFKYKYPNNPGEDIRITGNTESLGNWNYDNAPKLFFDPKKDCWKTKTYIKIPASFNLEYKYLIFKDNQFEKMEQIDSNRKVAIPEREKLVFSDEQNNSETKVIKHFTKNKKKVCTGLSGKNLKTPLKSVLKPPKVKKNSSSKKATKIKTENILENKNNKKSKKINSSENDDSEEYEIKDNEELLDESIDEFQELNYDSSANDEDAYLNTKMTTTELIKNIDILDDKDEIIMVSTNIPFNPVRNKDGTFDFILTNEAIYHTLYRIIESKKILNGLGI